MTFLNPIGLLALLSIIALIIIYIIKPKYQDKEVSSSFIWKLSLKYKKRKLPFQWLRSSLVLILQLLALTLMTVIAINPNLVHAKEQNERIAILDISASMMADLNGKTRLSRAKEEILSLAKETIDTQQYFSLIIASSEPYLLVTRTNSYHFLAEELNNIESDYATADIDKAMALTQEILINNPQTEVIYYTSEHYDNPGEVKVRDLSLGEWNVAIQNFEGKIDDSYYYVFNVELASYGKDAEVILNLVVDGKNINSARINLKNGVTTAYAFKEKSINESTFEYAKVEVVEVEDHFKADNSLEFYNEDHRLKVQIVSNYKDNETDSDLTYIQRALSRKNYQVQLLDGLDTESYKAEGFDLYIYITNVPDILPKDGAIWVINPETLSKDLGISYGVEKIFNVDTAYLESDVNNPIYQEIMRQVRPNLIQVTRYKSVVNQEGYEVLMHHENNPLILTKTIDKVKTTIFNFGLSYSNFPLLIVDFPLFINHLADYSTDKTFDKLLYDAGEKVSLYAKPNTVSMTVENKEGTITLDKFPSEIKLSQTGIHTVTQTDENGNTKKSHFYVKVPLLESNFNYQGNTLNLPIIAKEESKGKQENHLQSILPYLAAALVILLLVEWKVQYREQY